MEKTKKGEIILYQPEGGEFHIDVRLEDDTVWLTQAQMAELFNATKQNISLHIANIFKEEELVYGATVKESLTVQKEGNRRVSRKLLLYNLDVIISVGYRVKSIQGTRFRQWAIQILKEYLLKGESVNQRLVSQENRIDMLDNRIGSLEKQVEFFVKANMPPDEGILAAHAYWSGYEFACQLIRSAKSEIVIVDPFGDDVALSLLSKKMDHVKACLYSAHITRTLKDEAARLNRQNPTVELCNMREVHDRFIIVDETVYHIGASLKDLGNQLTAFSVLHFVTKEQLLGMVK